MHVFTEFAISVLLFVVHACLSYRPIFHCAKQYHKVCLPFSFLQQGRFCAVQSVTTVTMKETANDRIRRMLGNNTRTAGSVIASHTSPSAGFPRPSGTEVLLVQCRNQDNV